MTDKAGVPGRPDISLSEAKGEPAAESVAAKASYTVGYRRPPAEHRFTPGQSGNKRGRPRRSQSTAAVFEEMFRSTVAMTIDGRRRRLTIRQVMALRAMKELLTGSPRAIERWLAYAEKVEPRSSDPQASSPIGLDSLTDDQLRALASIRIAG